MTYVLKFRNGQTVKEVPVEAANTAKEAILNMIAGGERNFRGLDLASDNEKPIDLKGIDLADCIFSGASLKKVDLSGCRMDGVALRGAWLDEVTFDDARMEKADLSTAHLKKSSFVGAQMAGSLLRETQADEETTFSKAILRGADFKKAVMDKTRLDGADLRHTKVEKASFKGCMLEGAVLTGMEGDEAKFDGAMLANVESYGTRLTRASFKDVQKAPAKFDDQTSTRKALKYVGVSAILSIGLVGAAEIPQANDALKPVLDYVKEFQPYVDTALSYVPAIRDWNQGARDVTARFAMFMGMPLAIGVGKIAFGDKLDKVAKLKPVESIIGQMDKLLDMAYNHDDSRGRTNTRLRAWLKENLNDLKTLGFTGVTKSEIRDIMQKVAAEEPKRDRFAIAIVDDNAGLFVGDNWTLDLIMEKAKGLGRDVIVAVNEQRGPNDDHAYRPNLIKVYGNGQVRAIWLDDAGKPHHSALFDEKGKAIEVKRHEGYFDALERNAPLTTLDNIGTADYHLDAIKKTFENRLGSFRAAQAAALAAAASGQPQTAQPQGGEIVVDITRRLAEHRTRTEQAQTPATEAPEEPRATA